MKKVLSTIWMVWVAIVFVISLIVVTPIYYILLIPKDVKAEARGHKLSRIWAFYLLFMFGIRIKVYGREKLHPGTAYMFVSNHQSMLDIPICAVSTNHFFKFLAKEDLVKIPLLGYIIKRLYITVSRGSMRDRAKSIIKMRDALKEGTSVWIFPEGTRNKTDEPLTDLQDGAFQVAASAEKPLAIATFVGVKNVHPSPSAFELTPGTIRIYWDVLPVTKDVEWLRERTREIITERLTAK